MSDLATNAMLRLSVVRGLFCLSFLIGMKLTDSP